MDISNRPRGVYFGLTKRDFGFTLVVFGIILIAAAILIFYLEKPTFDINSFQKLFLAPLSISILIGLMFASMYAYLLLRNTSFLLIALCWLANMVYEVCSMLENTQTSLQSTQKQKYVTTIATFVVALTADVPLFLSAFSEQQRRWWLPILPLSVILLSVAFLATSQLPSPTTVGILYLVGPWSSAVILIWLSYSLVYRGVIDPSIKYVTAYSLTFLIIGVFQVPFFYQRGLCHFVPSLFGCLDETILNISRTAILIAKMGNLFVVFLIIRDSLKGLKSAEQKLKIKGEFEELGYFAASLEHELRNPRAVLGNEIDFLKKHMHADLQTHFDTVERQLNRISGAAGIINVLRSKREEIKLKAVPIVATINLAIKDIKKEFGDESANVFFEVVDRTNQASIEAEPYLIEQCLVNLLKNSIEAIKRGGKTGEIAIETTLKDENTVAVSVRDNGDGFVADDIPLLTDPGYTRKVKSTTKSNRGLGLFVCYRIVELHDGKISFSNLAKGAEVRLEFARYVSKRSQKSSKKVSGGNKE